MDELIADLDAVVEATPPQFNNQMPSFTDITYWSARSLRRLDAEWDGKDPDEFDPTYEEEFAEFRARWMTCTMPWPGLCRSCSSIPKSRAFLVKASICARATSSAIGSDRLVGGTL